MRFARWMSYFWYRCACPEIDSRFNYWLRGKPYNWTKRLHMPWWLLVHPEDARRSPRLAGWRKAPRAVASLLCLPIGFAIWVGYGRHWPLFEVRSAQGPIPSPGRAP